MEINELKIIVVVMVKAIRDASNILNPVEITNSIMKQIYLNFKYISSSFYNFIIILLFPVIMIIMPIFFIPLKYSFGVYLFVSCVIPVGIVYVSIGYEWRRSTLFINQKTTKGNRVKLYLSLLFTMLIICTILIVESFIVMIICNPLFTTMWVSSPEEIKRYYILKTHIGGVFYTIYLSTLILFTLLYFFQSIMKNKKSMYILLLSIIIIDILFGGALNGYFTTVKNRGYYIGGMTMDEWSDLSKIEKSVGVFFGPGSLFPGYLFWPTAIFFPFFGPTQQLSSIGATSLIWDINEDGMFNKNGFKGYIFWFWSSPNTIIDSWTLEPLSRDVYAKWNVLWIIPYIWMFILGSSGLLISSHTKK